MNNHEFHFNGVIILNLIFNLLNIAKEYWLKNIILCKFNKT